MKVKKRALFEVLQQMNKIVPPKSNLEILTTVKLESIHDTLTVTGTDMENTLIAEVPCEGEMPSVCVNARQLQQILKPVDKSDDSAVTMVKIDAVLSIGCLSVKTNLPTMDVADFPVLAETTWELAAIWPAKKLLDALKFTAIAACDDSTRPAICCVCITGNAVVGTNGHSLHTCAAPAPIAKPLLLRLDTVNVLLRILGLSENVIIARSDDHVKAKVGNLVLQGKLINEEYPPYEQVIPKGQSTMIKVETAGFVRALKSVCALTENIGVKMTVNGAMELSVDSVLGSVAVGVPLRGSNHVGDLFIAGYNPAYLLDAIPQGSSELTISMDQPLDPIVIRDDGNNRKAVLMPMRL